MIKKQKILDDIEKLRKQHTVNFEQGRFKENDTIDRKIKEKWEQYHKYYGQSN